MRSTSHESLSRVSMWTTMLATYSLRVTTPVNFPLMCNSLRTALGSLYSKRSRAGFLAEVRAALMMATQTWETHRFSSSPLFLKFGGSSAARAEEQSSTAPQRRATPSDFVSVIVVTPDLRKGSPLPVVRKRHGTRAPLFTLPEPERGPQRFFSKSLSCGLSGREVLRRGQARRPLAAAEEGVGTAGPSGTTVSAVLPRPCAWLPARTSATPAKMINMPAMMRSVMVSPAISAPTTRATTGLT